MKTEEMLESSEYQRLQKELLKVQLQLGKTQLDLESWKIALAILATGATMMAAAIAVAAFVLTQFAK